MRINDSRRQILTIIRCLVYLLGGALIGGGLVHLVWSRLRLHSMEATHHALTRSKVTAPAVSMHSVPLEWSILNDPNTGFRELSKFFHGLPANTSAMYRREVLLRMLQKDFAQTMILLTSSENSLSRDDKRSIAIAYAAFNPGAVADIWKERKTWALSDRDFWELANAFIVSKPEEAATGIRELHQAGFKREARNATAQYLAGLVQRSDVSIVSEIDNYAKLGFVDRTYIHSVAGELSENLTNYITKNGANALRELLLGASEGISTEIVTYAACQAYLSGNHAVDYNQMNSALDRMPEGENKDSIIYKIGEKLLTKASSERSNFFDTWVREDTSPAHQQLYNRYQQTGTVSDAE